VASPSMCLECFFHKFTAWMVEKYFDDNVHMPSDTAELESVETMYSLLGLPSCVGSMDVVHFAWDNCPARSVPAFRRWYAKSPAIMPTMLCMCTALYRVAETTKTLLGRTLPSGG
jgi:hypothetical protein